MSTTTIASSSAIMLGFSTGFDLIFYSFGLTLFLVIVLFFINLGARN